MKFIASKRITFVKSPYLASFRVEALLAGTRVPVFALLNPLTRLIAIIRRSPLCLQNFDVQTCVTATGRYTELLRDILFFCDYLLRNGTLVIIKL